MITKIAWNTFKNTGNIDTFMEFKQLQNLENGIKVKEYENSQNEGNNNCREYNV